jgi:hypothetical protein
LAGGPSPYLILFPDAIMFIAFSFYDDIIFRVIIGHRGKNLSFYQNLLKILQLTPSEF